MCEEYSPLQLTLEPSVVPFLDFRCLRLLHAIVKSAFSYIHGSSSPTKFWSQLTLRFRNFILFNLVVFAAMTTLLWSDKLKAICTGC